jgi:hypothetical protein
VERFIRLSERFYSWASIIHFCVFIYAKRNRFQTAPARLGNGNFFVCVFFTWGKRAEVANHRLWELKSTKRNRVGPNQLFNYSLTSRRFFNVRSKKVGKFRTVQTERHLARNVHTADTWTKNEKQTKYSFPIDFATWRWTLQSRLGSFSSPVVNKKCFVIEENDQISN